MPVSLTVYDGAQSIGGNKIFLEDSGTAVFLDFGTPFSTRGRYFEEFLAPRSRAGLLDLIHMGLLPPLRGIYRQEMEGPGGRVWERASRSPHFRQCRADAVLLSHAHMDHCGYISFLDTNIPVVCTAMTAYLCKAIQDCGAHQFEGEMCYTTTKVPGQEGTIGTGRHKEFPYVRRLYKITDSLPGDPERFWNLSPSAPKGRYFGPQELALTERIGGLRVRFLPVDHSIYGAAAVALETSAGWIVYTGDLRRHGRDRAATEAFIQEAAQLQPVMLICEGTNIERGPGNTEEAVFEACLEVVRENSGKFIVADFGPRNVERLLVFLEICRQTGRRLAIMEKDAYLLTAMQAVDPSIPTPANEPTMVVYRRAMLKPDQWSQTARHWYPNQVNAAQIGADPGVYIVCMSFFDITELVDIDPSGGVWIYSSSEPHDEEQQFELKRLLNWLDLFKITPLGVGDSPSPYHASGHISGPELVDLIRQINPTAILPVHTESPSRFVETLYKTAAVRLPETGVSIEVS